MKRKKSSQGVLHNSIMRSISFVFTCHILFLTNPSAFARQGCQALRDTKRSIISLSRIGMMRESQSEGFMAIGTPEVSQHFFQDQFEAKEGLVREEGWVPTWIPNNPATKHAFMFLNFLIFSNSISNSNQSVIKTQGFLLTHALTASSDLKHWQCSVSLQPKIS